MIIKNDIPLLEYDDCSPEVIAPDHDTKDLKLPEKFLFTADSLANVHEYDARSFGKGSHEKALLLGLDILRDYN